jgi:CBS domain-containing protein
MKVQEIMTRGVECVGPQTSILQAAEKMRDRDVGFLAVCENDRLIGTVTDRDITIRSVAQGRDPRQASVQEIMSPEVFCCYEDDDVQRVSDYMQEKEVRRLLILNSDKRLAGVVSLGDIAKVSGDERLAGETLGHIAEAA